MLGSLLIGIYVDSFVHWSVAQYLLKGICLVSTMLEVILLKVCIENLDTGLLTDTKNNREKCITLYNTI